MSQPFSRREPVPAPGPPDRELGEFWVTNPWYIQQSQNLSSFERNRFFQNTGSARFVDISHLSGADSDGDARSAMAANLRENGQLDLIVRQCGGGGLLVFENQTRPQHWLEVSLQGTQSNRLGVGARIDLYAGGKRMVRELQPVNSYRSQTPFRAHFGLGQNKRIDHLTIHWPSGREQTVKAVPIDQHVVIQEGADNVQRVIPGEMALVVEQPKRVR